jgi:hypothetical protein
MRLLQMLGIAAIAVIMVACGPRQPAEAPAERAAPPEVPAPIVPEPIPDPLTEPAGAPPGLIEIDSIPADETSADEEFDDTWPKSPMDDPEALLAEWRGIVDNPDARARELRLQKIGLALVNNGPEACQPIIDIMSDDTEDPMVRYLAMISLEEWVMPPFLEVLTPMVSQDEDETTRSFGAYLIGLLETKDTIPLLEELVKEENRRIQFGAMLGLARLKHAGYEGLMLDTFRSEGTPAAERTAIAFLFAERIDPLMTDFYLEAAADPTLEADARAECLKSLSQIADPSTLPELQAIADDPNLADNYEVAMYAIQNIERVQQGAVQPFPPIQ